MCNIEVTALYSFGQKPTTKKVFL